MTRIRVDVGNFARAETHRMMADPQREAGDINQFRHNRAPASVDTLTAFPAAMAFLTIGSSRRSVSVRQYSM